MSLDTTMSLDPSVVRVAGVYATPWRYRKPAAAQPITFAGTRFSPYSEHFPDQLKRLPSLITAKREVQIELPTYGVPVLSSEVYLFALPSDQVVATLVVACGAPPSYDALDNMLDEFTDDNLRIVDGGRRLALDHYFASIVPDGVENFLDEYRTEQVPSSWLRRVGEALRLTRPKHRRVKVTELRTGTPERHEVIFLKEPVSPDEAEKLLYRRKERHRKEFTRRIDEFRGLNEQPSNLTATSPHLPTKQVIVTTRCSIIQGHRPMLESSALLSAVQAVGTLARFRSIWDGAYELVSTFRKNNQAQGVGSQRRDDLEGLADELGNLEFDLTFSVEFPLMRVESIHRALFKVLDVTEQANRLRKMFIQLNGSVRSEITAIDIRDTREDEIRRRRNDMATLWAASVGVPLTALLAFFGISSREVTPENSILDVGHYLPVYLTALVLGLLPALVLWLSRRLARRRETQVRKKVTERRAAQQHHDAHLGDAHLSGAHLSGDQGIRNAS